MVSLDDIKAAASALSPLAHLATVGPDLKPDVTAAPFDVPESP